MAVATQTSDVPRIQLREGPPPPEAAPVDTAVPRSRRLYVGAAVLLTATALAIAAALPRWFATAPMPIVTASGRIEAREVTIAPKDIQGRVKRVLIDEGQIVGKGDLLAELESGQLEARDAMIQASIANLDVQIRQATLDVAYTAKNCDAAIAAAEAAVSSARARVLRASAVLANARSIYQRSVSLLRDAVISRQEFEQAELSVRTAEADVEAADKDVARAEADLALARASKDSIALKRQQVRALEESRRVAFSQQAEARANLAEQQVRAPIDGTILSRTAEVGDVVASGSPLFVMVDMNRLYLKVYIPETDIGKLRLGDPADVSVDAFPHRVFPARVSKISSQAEFTPKNVETAEERLKLVFGVELTFTNPDRLLKPGMPADGVIHWTPSGPDGGRHGS
jgi:HlyD family secretion protein